jgi:hypothetical protein
MVQSTRRKAEGSLTGRTALNDLFEGTDTVDLFLSGKSLRELREQQREPERDGHSLRGPSPRDPCPTRPSLAEAFVSVFGQRLGERLVAQDARSTAARDEGHEDVQSSRGARSCALGSNAEGHGSVLTNV